MDGVTPPGMRVLDLRGNQIRYLGIATIIASLKTLDLSGNPTLECVDAAKHSLPRLHTARFRETALRELQCLAQACPKVSEVDIGGCYFMMHLPKMKNVKKLFLDGCSHPQLLDSLQGMPRLQCVWVDPHLAPEVRFRLGHANVEINGERLEQQQYRSISHPTYRLVHDSSVSQHSSITQQNPSMNRSVTLDHLVPPNHDRSRRRRNYFKNQLPSEKTEEIFTSQVIRLGSQTISADET